MAGPELISFEEALASSEEVSGKRHLLLGNGFSIACRPDSFAYGKLVDEADFTALQVSADSLFALCGTADFERAIEALRVSAAVLDLYPGSSTEAIEQLRRDAECLKEALADVLAAQAPRPRRQDRGSRVRECPAILGQLRRKHLHRQLRPPSLLDPHARKRARHRKRRRIPFRP